ncbi:YceI family protein [Hymenobacter negativus]|uniref:YceI family protein n=1 Tax=Hymenobacter negativus TaxID=2795026 RepID=A0ABS0QAD1_9BACT|nr:MULTISPECIES: YceI family protein [Bacteria]MBH8559293.1 YceI family protein [Hymenobacter negativus]MBH8570026.1 YceI family protein [Hymenobacter negativus]MBR7209766.1 YceI family protein [Microvirga sp. STS02]
MSDTATAATATKWTLDPTHSEIQFKIKHLVISTVTGSFKSFQGSMQSASDDNFENAQVEFSLNVDSIDTNQEMRDGHLKGEEFFDAAKYPTIKFESTSFVKDGDGYKVTGNLTMKDVTKPVTLEAEYGGSAVDFYGNHKAGFEVTGKINRKEFGLTWGGITEAGAIVLGDDVKLIANVQFAKQA